jgi:protein-tyrosine phosphatase
MTDRTQPVQAVALVCLGNICRSPTAQVVLEHDLAAAGLADVVSVASAGTGDWHVGQRMDARAAAALRMAGYDPSSHRARQIDASWFDRFDLLLAMDEQNLADLLTLAPHDAARERVARFRSYDPAAGPGDQDVPDPWFGGDGGFDEVLAIVQRTTGGLVQALRER